VETLAVQGHGGQIAGKIVDDLDPPLLGLGADEVQDLGNLHVQVARFEFQPPHLGKIQELIGQQLLRTREAGSN
jgi:hypothetical protein